MFLKEHVIFISQYWLGVLYTFEMVNGKTTYEWHTDDIQVHTTQPTRRRRKDVVKTS